MRPPWLTRPFSKGLSLLLLLSSALPRDRVYLERVDELEQIEQPLRDLGAAASAGEGLRAHRRCAHHIEDFALLARETERLPGVPSSNAKQLVFSRLEYARNAIGPCRGAHERGKERSVFEGGRNAHRISDEILLVECVSAGVAIDHAGERLLDGHTGAGAAPHGAKLALGEEQSLLRVLLIEPPNDQRPARLPPSQA